MPRIPLAYPKIPASSRAQGGPCIAFEKYDGTNLHWVWDCELGWSQFGVRRARYDFDAEGIAAFSAEHEGLAQAASLFERDFAAPLDAIFRRDPRYGLPQITVFAEFFGPNSFAGRHKADDDKQLVLFDVQTPAGIIPPAQFVADFADVSTARMIYRGKLTGKFAEEVRTGKYDVAEGVVCKGGTSEADLWMVKIKTYAYLERLKQAFGEDWEAYWE